MKKSFAISALSFAAIVFGTTALQAQATAPAVATATVSIKLQDVISIDPGSAAIAENVNFVYNTASDYFTDQTISKANSLKVTSTKSFDVKVKAEQAFFKSQSHEIPVNVLTIKPSTAAGTMGGTKNTVVLSTNDQTLVSGAALGSELTLNLDYTIPAAKAKSTDILGKPAGTYTQKVIYTATTL